MWALQRDIIVFAISKSLCLFQLINKGKGEALRIRAILRSLVPTEDLVGIISIPLKMPITNKGTSQDVHSDNTQKLTFIPPIWTHPIHLPATTTTILCLTHK